MDEHIFMKFALRYGPEKVKAKYHCLKYVHLKFSELINHTGVTWDAVSGKVFANDTVWDEFFKRDKVFKSFKKKGCKIYSLLSLVFNSSTASGAFHNASTCAPQTSEEEHRIEDEYLEGGSFGESEFNGGSRKGKRMLEEEMEGLPGSRRMKKGPGNSKYDTLLDAFSESIVARKERDFARSEHYKSKYGDVTSSLTEELIDRGILN
uniref:Myb/SANT-like domain-containing protein n=1 Tax=Lactuca sativa TaxID=4236 RepID=A0A9R1UKP2_LACSA|nr:hypothetical protein LSAT_V11C800406580 [Lactuca sativa]